MASGMAKPTPWFTAIMAAYQLTEDASDDDPPVIHAVRNPNTLVLTAILNEGICLLNKSWPFIMNCCVPA
jgi:hypothetical protein